MSDKLCYYMYVLAFISLYLSFIITIVVKYVIVGRLRAWSGPSYEIKIPYSLSFCKRVEIQ